MDLLGRNQNNTVILIMESMLGSRTVEACEATSVIPGVFFLLLGLTWFQQHLCSSPPPRVLTLLPWTAVISLVLSGLAILASVMGHPREEEKEATVAIVAQVTLYLAFSLPGLLSTLSFYSSRSRVALPRHSSLLATSLAFLLELLLPPASCPLLLFTIAVCALISLARLLVSSSPSSLSCLLLCLLTQVQGSWLLHTSLSPPSPTWQATYFSWHVLATFTLNICTSVTLQAVSLSQSSKGKVEEESLKTNSASPTSFSSSSSTVSSTLPVKGLVTKPCLNTSIVQFVKEKEFKEFIKENPNLKELIIDKDELMTPKIFERQSVTEAEVQKSASDLVKMLDSEKFSNQNSEGSKDLQMGPREAFRRSRRNSMEHVLDEHLSRRKSYDGLSDRVSPLEEFNTLHRNQSSVRASIKLKESDLV